MHPVELRLNSTDAEVYGQVLVDEEYAGIAVGNAKTIVDCGANIGLTSAFLLSRLPEARVIAIEPFPSNVELCRRNLSPYGTRAVVIEAAIWSHETSLAIEQKSGNEWGVKVRPASLGQKGQIRAVDLLSLGLDKIDILKIDIEGSEFELFSANTECWLPTVGNIAIELHGDRCEHAFRSAMNDYDFKELASGELILCTEIRKRDTRLRGQSA